MKFIPYAVIALVSSGMVWWVMDLRSDNLEQATRISILESQLKTCTARVANILEDEESDNEIDLIPDDDLNSVPDDWLLPTP